MQAVPEFQKNQDKKTQYFQISDKRVRLGLSNTQEKRNTKPVRKGCRTLRARSLAQFIKDNPGLKGLRISMKGYVDQDWMENIPLIAIDTYFER